MDAQTIEQNYKQICALLMDRRLREALAMMAAQRTTGSGEWDTRGLLQEVTTSYGYMLRYMEQGAADPGRGKLYAKLLLQALHIADLQRIGQLQESSGHYCFQVKHSLAVSGVPTSLAAVRQRSEQFAETLSVCRLAGDTQRLAQAEQSHERDLPVLFGALWTGFSWDADAASEARQMLDPAGTMYDNDLCLAVSAITLSALTCYDREKLLWLLSACRYGRDERVALRALIGLALLLHVYERRVAMDADLSNQVSFLGDEVDNVGNKLFMVYMQLLHCQDAENVNRKMRDEIIPGIVQAVRNQHGLDLGGDDEAGDVNPEWEEISRKSIERMAEMQESGDDINLGTFQMLKRFPWFNETYAWFYPFDENISAIATGGSSPSFDRFPMHSLAVTDFFCDSDKYSFAFMMLSMSEPQRKVMLDRMLSQETLDALRAVGDDFTAARLEPRYIIRSYLQDLYRFFSLYVFRSQFRNVFAEAVPLHRNRLLRQYLSDPAHLEQIADYRFSRGSYDEAHAVYQDITAMGGATATVWQHDAFCLQKTGRYAEAVQAYSEALHLRPADSWTLRHQAFCHRKLGDFAAALGCYRQIEAMQPQDMKTAMLEGRCLTALQRYDEALQYFYKAEMADENNMKTLRAIGWCSFMLDKYDQAARCYGKLLASQEAAAADWLNAGHMHWCCGRTQEAARCYAQAYKLYNSTDDFRNAFLADQSVLTQKGINPADLPLMIDLAAE